MTQNPAIETIQNLDDGFKITPLAWCIYEEEKENAKGDSESVTILSIIDNSKEVYACQSPTFRKSFLDIAEIFEADEEFTIIKVSGTTKAGRNYINCILDTSNM